jgi:DNA-binding CsgD family transcriptional regulator
MDTTTFSKLISSIYEATLDPDGWLSCAGILARAFDTESCMIHVRDRRVGCATALGVTDNLITGKSSYEAYYYKTDVWVAAAKRQVMGKPVFGDELVSNDHLSKTEFYNDYAKGCGAFHVLGALLPVTADLVGAVAVHRSFQSSPFDARDKGLLSLLIPHLSRAMLLSGRLCSLESKKEVAFSALDTLGLGLLGVTAEGQLLFANPKGEEVLHRGECLSVTQGRVTAVDNLSNQSLQRAISDAADTTVGKARSLGNPVVIHGRNGSQTVVMVCPVPPALLDTADQRHLGAAILVGDVEPEFDPLESVLAQLYGLTPAEGRLARALLIGQSLQEYAAEVEITLNTVRNQLKQIFSKTGHTRQIDFVRHALSNPLVRMGSRKRGQASLERPLG